MLCFSIIIVLCLLPLCLGSVIRLQAGEKFGSSFVDGKYYQLNIECEQGVQVSFLNVYGSPDNTILGTFKKYSRTIKQLDDKYLATVFISNGYENSTINVIFSIGPSTIDDFNWTPIFSYTMIAIVIFIFILILGCLSWIVYFSCTTCCIDKKGMKPVDIV